MFFIHENLGRLPNVVRHTVLEYRAITFLEPCDLEIWRMTLKNNRGLFYATSSFVQHSVAIGESKLELESGNAQSGSNVTLFRAVWPWNLTDDLEKQ